MSRTHVRRARVQRVRTPAEDDGITVLRYGPSKHLDLRQPIACEAREGDDC